MLERVVVGVWYGNSESLSLGRFGLMVPEVAKYRDLIWWWNLVIRSR